MKYKVLLLDADGVTILAPQPYSYTYAEQCGLDPQKIEPFFANEFQKALRGEADLKELIANAHDTWQWAGDPQELLNEWFAAENVPSIALLPIIKRCRQNGMHVYLVTNQEKYRAKYLREAMFADVFDEILVSCELGAIKRQPEYWAGALAKIGASIPSITPQEILYLDDSPADVTTAKLTGIDAKVYKGPEQLLKLLGAA